MLSNEHVFKHVLLKTRAKHVLFSLRCTRVSRRSIGGVAGVIPSGTPFFFIDVFAGASCKRSIAVGPALNGVSKKSMSRLVPFMLSERQRGVVAQHVLEGAN